MDRSLETHCWIGLWLHSTFLADARTITRRLFSLAAPVIGLNLLAVLMLAVDSMLCGRLPDSENVLAALGYAVQIVFLLMVVMLGLMVGTIALVARAYGAKATDRIEELLVQSTQLTFLVGLIVGVLGALFAGPMLAAVGASPAVEAIGVAYLRPLLLGTPLSYLTLLYAGVFRAVGNTTVPFLCALVANVINAGLNYGLVLGNLGMPALGVVGSAISTLIAQAANVAGLVFMLRRGAIADIKLSLRPRPVDRKLAVELFRIGWPAALDMLVLNVGFFAALKMLAYIDQVTVAAHGLGLRVQSIAFVPGLGVSQATAALVGQSLGAGDRERARAVARAAMALCAAIMTILAISIIAAVYPLVGLFDVDSGSQLESYTVEWMRILGVAMIPGSINTALMGVLQGSGATRTSLRINIWTTLAIQVPLAWLFAFGLDLQASGVWLSFPVAFLAKAIGMVAFYRRGKWAQVGVHVHGKQ